MKKRNLSVLALASAAALSLSACAAAPESSPSASSSVAQQDYLACMVSDSGGFDDKSFNETSYNGLKSASEKLGVQMKTIQSTSDTDYAPNIQAMITAKCDLIISVGFALGDATIAAAKANPTINFALVDYSVDGTLPNLRGLSFNTAQSSFMAGYLAAGMSSSKKVGTFGGAPYPTVTIFMDGFYQGVEYYNSQKDAKVEVLGWDPAKPKEGTFVPGNSFEDQNGGKTTAESLISQGADVILPVAGPAGIGALQAAKASNGKVNAIWVDSDGCEAQSTYCPVIMSSVMKGMDTAVYDTVANGLAGKFEGGNYIGTLENEGTQIAPFHEFDSKVSAELKSELDKIKADIISGAIKIDSASQPK